MRYVELLRATVLLSAAAGTTLALLTVAGATADQNDQVVIFCAIWWLAACVAGAWLGGRGESGPSESIARALKDARAQTTLPEMRPGLTLVNRLWPLILATIVAGALAFLAPSVPGVAVGFCLIWALSWRRQHSAVQAIEERDGVTFYVDRQSPVGPLKLLRLPGFRREKGPTTA